MPELKTFEKFFSRRKQKMYNYDKPPVIICKLSIRFAYMIPLNATRSTEGLQATA